MNLTLKTARILVFLKNSEIYYRIGYKMAAKLDYDYPNLMTLMNRLVNRDWVRMTSVRGKKFFTITDKAPIQQAIETLVENGITEPTQTTLIQKQKQTKTRWISMIGM